MADEEFEIDVYGDADPSVNADAHAEQSENKGTGSDGAVEYANIDVGNGSGDYDAPDQYDRNNKANGNDSSNQADAGTGPTAGSGGGQAAAHSQQGIKRKEGADDRALDPGATSALTISDMQWYLTDDDLRGFAVKADCEDELKDVTFSEHKVNGKSKG